MNKTKTIKNLILTGHVEGISYLILLFIAMPLKYALNIPDAVRYIGMLHGILFVLFIIVILFVLIEKLITVKTAFVLFIISLIPFGTFFIKKILAKN